MEEDVGDVSFWQLAENQLVVDEPEFFCALVMSGDGPDVGFVVEEVGLEPTIGSNNRHDVLSLAAAVTMPSGLVEVMEEDRYWYVAVRPDLDVVLFGIVSENLDELMCEAVEPFVPRLGVTFEFISSI